MLSSFCAVFYFISLYFILFYFIFQDYCRAERSAWRYIPGETLLLRGRRPHLIQYLLWMIGEAVEEYYCFFFWQKMALPSPYLSSHVAARPTHRPLYACHQTHATEEMCAPFCFVRGSCPRLGSSMGEKINKSVRNPQSKLPRFVISW